MANLSNSKEIVDSLQDSIQFRYSGITEAKEQAQQAMEQIMFSNSFTSIEDMQEALKPYALLLDMLRQLD